MTISHPRPEPCTTEQIYPTNTTIDVFIKKLIAESTNYSHLIGFKDKDWDFFYSRPYLYPRGSGLSWHTDGKYKISGAYVLRIPLDRERRFQKYQLFCSPSRGITVHHHLESVFTFPWNRRSPSVEYALTMQDLVQASLRLRPDRLIMGEIRGKELLDFVSACATGHAGSITSLHAYDSTV